MAINSMKKKVMDEKTKEPRWPGNPDNEQLG
jgi:hypothetical protein